MYSNFRTPTCLCTKISGPGLIYVLKSHFLCFFTIKLISLNMLVLYHSWSIFHVPWIIWLESGLRNIDFRRRYYVEKLAQYRWLIRYNPIMAMGFSAIFTFHLDNFKSNHYRHPIAVMGVVDTLGMDIWKRTFLNISQKISKFGQIGQINCGILPVEL